MLTTLFPTTYARFTSLPVLGIVLENLCSWLESRGYPANAITRRIQAAPFLDQCLRERHIQSLSGCTAEQLRACFPTGRSMDAADCIFPRSIAAELPR